MAGHWRQRGNRIELRAFSGRDPLTGKKRYATRLVPLVGKREADKALAAFVAEVGEGTAARPRAGRTFGELLEAWFEARSGDWSPATAYQTRWMIDHRAAGLVGRPLKAIDVSTLDRFYAELRKRGGKDGAPLSVASVQRVHAMLRLALEQAVKWGWRSDDPAVHARPGKAVPTRFTPPTADEVIQLLEAAEDADPEFLVFLFLDAETGARRGELSALRFNDEFLADGFVFPAEIDGSKPWRPDLVLGWCRHGALHIAVRDNVEDDEIVVETAYRPDPALWEADYRTRKP